ncbi:MAG TPA: hypothetical protein V6D04_11650 [Candidatus Obscuribacterales bacterium]
MKGIPAIAGAVWVGLQLTIGQLSAIAVPQPLATNNAQKDNRQRTRDKLQPQPRQCPADLESLTALLVRDLPSYANRIYQRSRPQVRTRLPRGKTAHVPNYVIVAGRADVNPLNLGPGIYTPPEPGSEPKEPDQVFLTTLERQYTFADQPVQLQQFHWLFLVQTPSGWRLAMAYSRFSSYPPGSPPSPPRETSNAVLGQAVHTWLDDCRAGRIRPLPTASTPKSP